MSAPDPTQSDGTGRDYRSFDGETYGESFQFNRTGDFERNPDGSIRLIAGPPMVNRQLIRVLRTPKGDDPLRPELGLDLQKLLNGRNTLLTKEAVIEAIGPDADPRVASLTPDDITIFQPGGTRENAEMTVRGELADGSPMAFSLAFEDLLKNGTTDANPSELPTGADARPPANTGEGFGNNFGRDFGN